MVKKLLTLTFILGSIFTQNSRAAIDMWVMPSEVMDHLQRAGALNEFRRINNAIGANEEALDPIMATIANVLNESETHVVEHLQGQFPEDSVNAVMQAIESNSSGRPTNRVASAFRDENIRNIPQIFLNIEATIRPQIAQLVRTHQNIESGIDIDVLVDDFTRSLVSQLWGSALSIARDEHQNSALLTESIARFRDGFSPSEQAIMNTIEEVTARVSAGHQRFIAFV